MPRLSPVDPQTATGPLKETLDGLAKKLGKVPNMMRTMAQSPAVLDAYIGLSQAASRTSLPAGTREALALALGQRNGCEYCVTAHSLLGQKAGLDASAVSAAREGRGRDARESAILAFALAVNDRDGHVTDAEFKAARGAGLSDAVIAEIVAVVALNVFTNWFNHVAEPEIDFPRIEFKSTRGA